MYNFVKRMGRIYFMIILIYGGFYLEAEQNRSWKIENFSVFT